MRRKMILCALLLAPVLAFGQTAGVNTERPRSSYDPGASLNAKGQQQSGVAAALEKINPQDKDYGQVIDQGRIALFEQSIEDFYWRSCMVLTVLLILSLMYIVWLWRERDLRLNVSADIVAQLFNSHVAARAKALEAIDLHNKLARRYNAKCLELAEAREAEAEKEQRKTRKGDEETADKLAANPAAETETKDGSRVTTHESEVAEECSSTEANDENSGADTEITRLNGLVQNLQAQAKAQNQKISNLRSQLNRAHDQYKVQPYQVRES